ncbi:hypothetical protein V6N13_124364 [Hibiscus sabdariffa]
MSRVSSNLLEGLTADPTLGDGTSPGKPPEPDDCYGCCSTHGINLDGNMDDSTLVDNNRPGNMVDSALVDNNRPGDEGRTAAQNQISSTQGIGISDVSLPKVSFRDTVVGRTKTGSVVSEIPELDVLIGDDNFRFEVQDEERCSVKMDNVDGSHTMHVVDMPLQEPVERYGPWMQVVPCKIGGVCCAKKGLEQ